MPRGKKQKTMPEYTPTAEEHEAYMWGVEEGIIISPMGIKGTQDEWKVGIANSFNYKDVKLSPETYGPDEIWQKVFEFYLYYYNKSGESTKDEK